METPGTVPSGSCRAELERVLNSRTFSKSARLRALLEYIAKCSLEGRLEDLSEQQIGISVFHRPPGYNSTEDTIVRVSARHLRERLDLYYRDEGKGNPCRVAVPKGSYVATFHAAPAQGAASGSAALSAAAPAASVTPVRSESGAAKAGAARRAGWMQKTRLALLACAFLVIALLMRLYQSYRLQPQPQPQAERALESFGPPILWQALFTPGRKTLIVPGDASLDAYIAWEQRSVPLANYTNQDYQSQVTVSRPPGHKDVPLGVRSVTPMADLRMVSDLVRIPEWMQQPAWDNWIEICYARDMVVASTHNNNLILIGSETFNPWVTLYQRALDFYVHWDYVHDVYYVTNHAPRPGEQTEYIYDRHTPGLKAYTLVALTDNVQGEGRVMLIEGTSMGTTYGALNFFTNEKLWGPVIRAATDKYGKLHNFEVLLSSDFVRGGTSNTQIVALHLHG
ncbi:MAG TPA: hypothetical protein VKU93_05425 [Terracidiphilus sp.]|nr:hypothetical protein [Terracidiphilus sp.]